jgi:glycopeptide antibiotics resistance protein
LFVLLGSFAPFVIQEVSLQAAFSRFYHLFTHPVFYSRSDFVANFLLFIPLSFLGYLLIRGDGNKIYRGIIICFFSLILSASIEFLQVQFPFRVVSWTDAFAETLGGAFGVVLGWIFGDPLNRRLNAFHERHFANRPELFLLTFYIFFVLGYFLFPFELTMSPANMYHKWKCGFVFLVPFSDMGHQTLMGTLEKIILPIPLGALFYRLRFIRIPGTIGAMILGLFFSIVLELLQILSRAHSTSATDSIFVFMGISAGIILSFLFRTLNRVSD